MLISLSACSSAPKPEDTVTAALDAFKEGTDLTTLASYFSEQSEEEIMADIMEELGTSSDAVDYDYVNGLFMKVTPAFTKNLTYKVLESEVTADTAIVKMEISNMDYTPVVEAFIPELTSYIMQLYISGEFPMDDEITSMSEEELTELYLNLFDGMIDVLIEIIDETEEFDTITNEVEIELARSEEGKWYINDEDFASCILGNFQDAASELSETFGIDFDY